MVSQTLLGRRCLSGCKTWPADDTYFLCPICQEPTRLFRGMRPLSEVEAQSAMRHAEFDHFYAEEWAQDTTPLTDEELLEMGINVGLQAVPSDDLLRVPAARDPARIPRSPHRSGRRSGPSTAAS